MVSPRCQLGKTLNEEIGSDLKEKKETRIWEDTEWGNKKWSKKKKETRI